MSVSTLHLLSTWGKPLVRFELTTHALRMRCSTPELQRQMLCAAAAYHTIHTNASLFFRKICFFAIFGKFSTYRECRIDTFLHFRVEFSTMGL